MVGGVTTKMKNQERKQYIWSGMQGSKWVTTQNKETCEVL